MADPLGRAPLPLLIPAALAAALLALPVVGLLLATDWDALGAQLQDDVVRDALTLSLVTATVAVAISLVLGVPLAWLLAHGELRGRRLLRFLVVLPLALPPVAGGVALMAAFERSGLAGSPLFELTGATLPFTSAGLILTHVFVSLPFVVLAVEAAFARSSGTLDEAAGTLGASRWYAFRRVTLPLAMPGALAGLVLGWTRSLGEFGATITFAGDDRATQTLPALIHTTMQQDPDAARGLGVIMLAAAVIVLFLLRRLWAGGLR